MCVCVIYIYIYIYIYTKKDSCQYCTKPHFLGRFQTFGGQYCPPKVWKRPRKWGFVQYWHESFFVCDNFALIRDNTNYENIFYYINSLYIEKTYIFDSSKYPPLAAITALHNLGIRAVSLFKHWLDILLQASWRIAQRWFTLVGHFLRTSRSSLVAQLGWGRVIGEAIPWQTWCQLTVSSPNRICTAWKCA